MSSFLSHLNVLQTRCKRTAYMKSCAIWGYQTLQLLHFFQYKHQPYGSILCGYRWKDGILVKCFLLRLLGAHMQPFKLLEDENYFKKYWLLSLWTCTALMHVVNIKELQKYCLEEPLETVQSSLLLETCEYLTVHYVSLDFVWVRCEKLQASISLYNLRWCCTTFLVKKFSSLMGPQRHACVCCPCYKQVIFVNNKTSILTYSRIPVFQ